ncbi:MAG: T9SS type A sorting domain-containing protein [bacterium]
MRKLLTVLLFVFSMQQLLLAADVWTFLSTTGKPVTFIPAKTLYVGDLLNDATWYVYFTINQGGWDPSGIHVGIGQSTNDANQLTWIEAVWSSDDGNNRIVKADISNFRFTASGNWYYAGRAKFGGTSYYANKDTWTGLPTSYLGENYFTVNSLSNPADVVSDRDGTNPNTQVNLGWTLWNSKSVMIVRKAGSYSTAPTDGTLYNVSDACGGGIVVYKGSAESYQDTELELNTTYFYTVYSNNNNYYSIGAQTSAGTLPVELSSFTASITNNTVNLNWATATEINNYGFEVEKSLDKTNWNKIAFVEGHGNSNNVNNYAYTDNQIAKSGYYYYRLKQLDNDGAFTYSDITEVNVNMPSKFELAQNYPNPFNPTTKISYSIPEASSVKMTIYNTIGQIVRTINQGYKEAGSYTVEFNGSDLNSGIYFYKLEAGKNNQIRKMILIK